MSTRREPQQSRPPASGPGRPKRGTAALRARAGDLREGARRRAPDTATSLNNLAPLLRVQGDLAAARPLFERALAICEKALGREHRDTATNLNNLASCFRPRAILRGRGRSSSARWRSASGRSAPSIPIRREPQQSRRPASGWGDLAGARPLFERALAIWRRHSAPSIQIQHWFVRTNLAALRGG